MSNTAVPSKLPEDFALNIENLDKFSNSTSPTFTNRLGVVKPTLVGSIATIDAKVAAIEAAKNAALPDMAAKVALVEAAKNTAINTTIPAKVAEVSEAVAATYVGQAGAAKDLAVTARVAAEAARDALNTTGKVFTAAEGTAAGLAATTNGQQFAVLATDVLSYDIFRNNAGTALYLGTFSTANAVTRLIREEYTELYAYTIRDAAGRVAFGIKLDGTVVALDIQASTINGSAISAVSLALSSPMGAPQAFTINDSAGRTAFEIAADGTISVAELKATKINGGSALSLRPSFGGAFDGELIYFNGTGQSLATGPVVAITKAQEYDNIGFPEGVANPGTPPAYYPLTAANCSKGGDSEPPLFGALGCIKELIAQENGIVYTAQKYQLLGADNSHGGYGISALSKGQPHYNTSMLQANAAKTMAAAESRLFSVGAVFWTQGEADSASGYASYLAALKTLANDFNTDYKAISGQTRNIPFITYQVGSTTANRDVARAQLQASLDLPNLVYLACPMYQFKYGADGVHITSDSTKWYGGYQGLVYKRVVIDGLPWTATRPVSAKVSGKFANVRFTMNVKPLVLDTVLVPAQVNYGFTLVDAAGNDLPIASVSLVGPEEIKVLAVSAIPAGAKLRHGYNTAVGKGAYVGGCGNLRDSMGDIATYYNHPLHGWAAFFEFQLS